MMMGQIFDLDYVMSSFGSSGYSCCQWFSGVLSVPPFLWPIVMFQGPRYGHYNYVPFNNALFLPSFFKILLRKF